MWEAMQAIYKDPAAAKENLKRACADQGVDADRMEKEIWQRPAILGDLKGSLLGGFGGKKAMHELQATDFPALVAEYLECKQAAISASASLKSIQAEEASMYQARQASATVAAVRAALEQLEMGESGEPTDLLYRVVELNVFSAALPHHLTDAPEAAGELPFGRFLPRVTERSLKKAFSADPDQLEIKRLTLAAEVLHDCVVDIGDMRMNGDPHDTYTACAIVWAEEQAKDSYTKVLAHAKEIYDMISPSAPPPPPSGGSSSTWELAD